MNQNNDIRLTKKVKVLQSSKRGGSRKRGGEIGGEIQRVPPSLAGGIYSWATYNDAIRKEILRRFNNMPAWLK
jgi:hypothetical protein